MMRPSLKTTMLALLLSGGLSTTAMAAPETAVIDFEGVQEGTVLDSVGASSGSFTGTIGVLGTNPSLAGNAAVIFDATCSLAGGGFEGPGAGGTAADCSGADEDLFQPEHGNVLIVAENLDADGAGRIEDPDDADLASQLLDLDLSSFGPGRFDVTSVDILDVDGPETSGSVTAFRDGVVVGEVAIPVGADGGVQTLQLGFVDVDALRFDLAGSGAIDNLVLVGDVPEEPPTEEPPTETPPTVQPPPTGTGGPPPTPGGGVKPDTAVPGQARLASPGGCVKGSFKVRVRGRAIASVRFFVNGKRVRVVREPNSNGAFVVRINSVKYGVGRHKLTARVKFEASSGTPARTLSARFFRCRPATLPRFTG